MMTTGSRIVVSDAMTVRLDGACCRDCVKVGNLSSNRFKVIPIGHSNDSLNDDDKKTTVYSTHPINTKVSLLGQ